MPATGTDDRAVDASDGVAVPVVGVGLLLALLVGLAVGYVVRLLTAGPAPSGTPDHAGSSPAAADAAVADARRRTAVLADALADVRDRTDNRAISDRIGAALDAAGWTAVDPTGGPFDPEVHRAVDRELTADPGRHGTVAATERLGYADELGGTVRLPEVIVFHHEPTGPTGPTRSGG
ncbi:hypothetical protein [Dermatobacter hominis]|uniref:hypothetical protein n=1 Tax=Dermatobacter hominis TaxID=2884263 RepID=UPI001D10A673|nr:hypothetical protein [Dermatobacter hominis]UDY35002.1 hypothetical protein LH044_16890 [Dermatobacter hominis]